MHRIGEHRRGDGLRALLLLGVVAGGIPAAQGFREDEVECEEAVAFLGGCCPNFDARSIHCEYIAGCDDPTYPDLQPSESECILSRSCSELRAAHVCENVLARATTDGGGAVPSDQAVCR